MWINKEKYELMNRIAENNEHDANLLRRLMCELKEHDIIVNSRFVIMSPEAYEKLSDKLYLYKDRHKEIESELEWYKVKYYELKQKVECDSVDDAADDSLIETVKTCTSESDHDWVGSLSTEPELKCSKCGQVRQVKCE